MPKESFFVRAADFFDVPADTPGGLLHIEISGRREVFIENHKGIFELGENEIILNISDGNLHIIGSRLRVSAMDSLSVRISGMIEKISFGGQEG